MKNSEISYQEDGAPFREVRIYRKALADGKAAYGFFNLSGTVQRLAFDMPVEAPVRDLWARCGLGRRGRLEMLLPAHGAWAAMVG